MPEARRLNSTPADSRPRASRRLAVIIFAAAIFAGAPLAAEVKVLKNFTLIDGTGRAPAAASAMIIESGKITWVGPAAQLKSPAGAEVSDLGGAFVMPGIINLHGHVGNTVDLTQDAKFYTRASVEKNLLTYARYGITTVQSLGTDQDLIFEVRAAQRAGRPSVARVFTAGQGFIYKGGYGGLAGVTPGYADAGEIEQAVAAQARKGVDVIKLWLDDELGNFPKMPYTMSKAIITAAHRHGLKAVAHIFYYDDARELVAEGVDGLAHSVRDKPIDAALLNSMKQHGTWQMAATLYREFTMFAYGKTPEFINDPFFTRGVSAAVVQKLSDPAYQKTVASGRDFPKYPGFLETAKENLKKEADAGVKYGFGTDTGPPGRFAGIGEHFELELMVAAGLTPMQALCAASRNAAEFLGAKDLGTLAPAKWADLIVLDANPLADIRNTRKIRTVYIAGNQVQ